MADQGGWDESMVREGCVCGHGQYAHYWSWDRPNGRCMTCECPAFDRDRRGDLAVVSGRDLTP